MRPTKDERAIVFFIPSIERGGVEANFVMASNGLAERGFKVEVLYCRASENGPFGKLSPKIVKTKFKRFPLPGIHPRIVDFYSALFILPAYFMKNNIRMIYSFQTSFAPLLIAPFFKIPVIPRVSNHPSAATKEKNLLQFLSSQGKKILYRLATKIIVNSEMNLNYYDQIAPGKVLLISNPVDLTGIRSLAEAFQPKIYQPDVRKLISVGRLVEQKNYSLLLKALAKLPAKDWELVLIGDGNLKESLIEESRTLGISQKIKFLGHQTNPFPYLKEAELFVQSSLYEGSPNALVEAFALGKMCVASDCESGPREVLQEGKIGKLYSNNNLVELTAVLNKVFENWNEEVSKMQSLDLKLERFSLEGSLKKYETLIYEN